MAVTNPDLVAEVRAVRAGVGGLAQLLRLLHAFRLSTLYGRTLPTTGYASILVSTDGQLLSRWICVYSSPELLETAPGAGTVWSATGAEVLDRILPTVGAVFGPTGVALDHGSDHLMALPPLPPIISPAAATAMAAAHPNRPRDNTGHNRHTGRSQDRHRQGGHPR